MVGSFAACSARALLGPITVATPTSVTNSRRFMFLPTQERIVPACSSIPRG